MLQAMTNVDVSYNQLVAWYESGSIGGTGVNLAPSKSKTTLIMSRKLLEVGRL